MKKMGKLMGIVMAAVLTAGTIAGCATTGGEGSDPRGTKEENVQKEENAGEKKDTLTVALTGEPPSLTTCDHDSVISVYMNIWTC